MKKIYSLLFLLFFCIITNVQAQDECVDATALTVGVMSCPGNGTMIDINNFTDSPNNPSCDNAGTNPDAWFTFVAPTIGIVDVTITGGDGIVEMAVFDACGGNEVFCNTNSNTEITGLVGGNTYILNIWEDVNGSGLLEVCLQEPPPPPANDECVNAIALTVNPMNSCPGNGTILDLSDATDSPNNPSCDNAGTNIDAWFSFVAPAGGAVQATINGGDGNVEAAVFDACNGNETFCDGAINGDIISGLVAGNTYILNVWEDVNGSGALEICLQEPPPPPSNTDCADAIDLGLIGPTGSCPGNVVNIDNTTGTSSAISTTNCDAGTNLDVFYTFTVPPSGNIEFTIPTTGGSTVEAAILSDCSGTTELYCDFSISGETVTGLTPGDVLYVQFYQNTPGIFSFCIEEPPPPPANDECVNAIAVTVNPMNSCPGNGTMIDLSDATDSPNNPSCDNTGTNIDAWFSFVAPAGGALQVTVNGGDGNVEAAIFDACNGNETFCDGAINGDIISGLVPGNTYILNIWEDTAGSGALEICLQEPPPPPSNTNCADAIDLGLVGPIGSCPNGLITVDNTNGTASPISSTNCDAGANVDLFYTITVPASGNIEFLATTTTGTGVEAAVLTDCSGTTELFCDASINGEVLTGLTPGDVLYVQFYQDTPGIFNFCIQEPPPPAPNDDVSNAIPLCTGQTLSATNSDATSDPNDINPSCIGSLENTVWFSFEADNVGSPITITVNESVLCNGSDLQVVILSGPANGPYIEEDCYSIGTPYTVGLTAPIPNMAYWLYIDGDAGAQCDFTVDIVGSAPCCGPELVVTPACQLGTEDGFFVDLAVTDLGDNPSGYSINSGAFPNITAIGNYQIGPFPNGMTTVDVSGLDITCDISFDVTQDCACIDSTITASPDTMICIGDQANLEAFLGDVIQIDTGTYTVITSAAGSCTATPTGTVTTETLGDDDTSNAIPLPFTFEFFGVPFNDFFISSNGFVSFGNGSTDLSQDPIPSPTTPNNIIALFWDDLDPVPNGTIIHFPSIVNNQNCYVVEFQDVEHFPGGSNNPTVSGQIIMCEDGTITINCIDCQVDGDIMGQGIENSDGSLGYFDPSLPNGETAIDLMNCVTFVPDSQSMTCDFLYWVTDLNDPAGSQVSTSQATSVSPMITTTYYAVASCNNTLFCTDSVTVDFGGLDCIECLSVVRVCDGNALYVTEDDSVEFPLPLVPNSAWVYEWYLDGVLEATVVGDSYYSPTNIGTYTVFVSNPNNGTSTETISPCNSLTIDEIIDCQDCGK